MNQPYKQLLLFIRLAQLESEKTGGGGYISETISFPLAALSILQAHTISESDFKGVCKRSFPYLRAN